MTPCSPDLGSVGQFFAKFEGDLRSVGAATVDMLSNAIPSFAPTACAEYFANARYNKAKRSPL